MGYKTKHNKNQTKKKFTDVLKLLSAIPHQSRISGVQSQDAYHVEFLMFSPCLHGLPLGSPSLSQMAQHVREWFGGL